MYRYGTPDDPTFSSKLSEGIYTYTDQSQTPLCAYIYSTYSGYSTGAAADHRVVSAVAWACFCFGVFLLIERTNRCNIYV